MRILLVEDDPMIARTLQQALAQDGYAVDRVGDGEAARLALDTAGDAYALVLLDLGLPRKSGLDLLRELRRGGQSGACADRHGARRGGGPGRGSRRRRRRLPDQALQPRRIDGAHARAARRDVGREDNLLRHGDLTLDTGTRIVTQGGRAIDVSAREFALLAALLERPGAALSKAQLEERIYRWGEEVESNAIEVHVHNLRKKLGVDAIRTLRGVGYALA